MVDDDVELSSELLDQVGNDDIDIDIDLLTAQQDEDFILEDAESEKDTEDAIAVNDDIMQDEENASYQMDDVDIMQEEHVENLQMEDAYQSRVLGADFASTKMSHNRSDIPEEYTEDINGASEAAMDDLTDHATFLGDSEVKQGLEVQGLSDTDFVKSREAENFELPPQLSTSEENLASEGQPRGRNSPASPGTTSPKSARPGTQDQTGHETISELVDQVAQDHNSADSVADKGKHAPQPKIIVVWRDAEYDLIAVSDTDDPDSFFLTDTKLIKEPFPSFIAALRDVVLDELNPEEELCLVIEDLGLEVTEVSLIDSPLRRSELILLIRCPQLRTICLSKIFWIFMENFCEMTELRCLDLFILPWAPNLISRDGWLTCSLELRMVKVFPNSSHGKKEVKNWELMTCLSSPKAATNKSQIMITILK